MNWLNAPVYRRVRRIDILLVLFGLICVGYYWYTTGWQGAILGGALYILMVMIGVWLI